MPKTPCHLDSLPFICLCKVVIEAPAPFRAAKQQEYQRAKRKKKGSDPLAEPQPGLQSKRRRLQEESVLTSSEEGVYQPKTKETRAAYEAMLSVIQQQLGGQPLGIVHRGHQF